jgi:hypothetical protein
MADNSKDTTDKKDEDVAAKNKDVQDLKGEVGIVKKYITTKNEKEAEENYQKNRLSKKIIGLGGLASLSPGLGKQSFKTKS